MDTYADKSPVRVLLNQLGKSLREAAEEIDCHYQVVYMADCGCYTRIPTRVRNWLSDRTGIPATELDRSYRDHQRMKRRSHPLGHISAVPFSDPNPVIALREVVGLSRMGFCKQYCVPSNVMYNLETWKPQELSTTWRQAVVEAGLAVGVVNHIAEVYVMRREAGGRYANAV